MGDGGGDDDDDDDVDDDAGGEWWNGRDEDNPQYWNVLTSFNIQ